MPQDLVRCHLSTQDEKENPPTLLSNAELRRIEHEVGNVVFAACEQIVKLLQPQSMLCSQNSGYVFNQRAIRRQSYYSSRHCHENLISRVGWISRASDRESLTGRTRNHNRQSIIGRF